jgi:osmoprotectant transport system ATP-binding protein
MRLQDEFLRLQRALGTTVVFVTHDVDEAIKMGTRVAVMQVGGRLAQYSAPADLLATPASDYVAEFVGADRALKRLSLFRLSDVPLEPPGEGTPADGMPRLPAGTDLRAALAALLTVPGKQAVVTGDDGRTLGVVTLETVASGVPDGRGARGLPA